MTPDSEILRGFGLVFWAGGVRNWYVGADGIRRWADNDQPVGTPTPEAPEPLNENPAPPRLRLNRWRMNHDWPELVRARI